MRNPSLHIRYTDLVTVLESLGLPDASELAYTLIKKSAKYSVRNRLMPNLNTKCMGKVIDKINIKTDMEDVAMFHTMLINVRTELNHKFMNLPLSSADKTAMEKAVATANEFVRLYSPKNKKAGYRDFIYSAIKLMGKQYNLNKFSYIAEKVFVLQDCVQKLEADTNKQGTMQFYKLWQSKLLKETGVPQDLTNDPTKLVFILYGREDADANKANYKDWIDAQFEGLRFMDVMPELGAFNGEGAKARYTKYMYDPKNKSAEITRIKYSSEAERIYYEKLKQNAVHNK